MKIRTDFVTNSSSVSFIITMHTEMVGIHRKFFGKAIAPGTDRVLTCLRDLMIKDGTRVMLEGEDIYTYKITFGTDEIMDADSYGRPHHEVDLEAMSDEDLWAYICGEYIMNGRIGNLRGFGTTQVETY